MFTAQITIAQQETKATVTPLMAVKAAFNTKKYRVEIYENESSLMTIHAKDEEEAKAILKNMITRLKRRYQ